MLIFNGGFDDGVLNRFRTSQNIVTYKPDCRGVGDFRSDNVIVDEGPSQDAL